MEQQPVVTAVALSPSVSTMEVSTPARQPAVAEPQIEPHAGQREEPKAQAFVAEAPMAVRAPVSVVDETVAAKDKQPAPVSTMRETALPADPKDLLSSSGLVMIETDTSRPKSYQIEDEPVQLGRSRRERLKQNAPEELMQVETKN